MGSALSSCRAAALLAALALALPATLPAQAEWTVLAYMSGDDDQANPVEGPQVRALLETASRIPGNAPIRFAAQLDRSPRRVADVRRHYQDPDYAGATRYVVGGGKVSGVETLGEVDMGDPKVLYDFLRWGVKNHPAKRYALVIAGHGSGPLSWRGPGSTDSQNPGEVRFAPGDPFVAYDDTDGDSLTVFELRAVLEAFRDRLNQGRNLDLVAFDACMPGSLEALYEVRDVVGIYVGSPSLTYYGAFPYTHVAASLAAAPSTSAEGLAELVAKGFIDRSGQNGKPDAMMAWRASAASGIAATLDALARELMEARRLGGKLAFRDLTAFWDEPHLYWDLGRFARSLARGANDLGAVANAARIQELGTELSTRLASARVAGWYDGAFAEAKIDGLSFFWGNREKYGKFRNFYKALALSRDASWDEFLDVMMLGHAPPATPGSGS